MPWSRPNGIWLRIHVNFFGPFQGSYFLVVLDAFSKWLEIKEMKHLTTDKTIEVLREIFCRWGLPLTLVSDNGTQLTFNEFIKFLKCNGIIHL